MTVLSHHTALLGYTVINFRFLQIIDLSAVDYDFGNLPVVHETQGGVWRVDEPIEPSGKKTEEMMGHEENESWLDKFWNKDKVS